MAINKSQAIQWKYNIQCAEVNGVLKDFSSPLTEEQINTAVSEYEVHLNSIQYQRDRANEYPSWQDQMDLQYWDKINNTSTWQDAVQAVKDKYPKP
jgi:hypothetical protein